MTSWSWRRKYGGWGLSNTFPLGDLTIPPKGCNITVLTLNLVQGFKAFVALGGGTVISPPTIKPPGYLGVFVELAASKDSWHLTFANFGGILFEKALTGAESEPRKCGMHQSAIIAQL